MFVRQGEDASEESKKQNVSFKTIVMKTVTT